MKAIKLKLPAISTRTVWIGSYGGHYSCVVIFHTKPIKSRAGRNYKHVDLLDNRGAIAACMWEADFHDIYPGAKIPAPEEIEVTTLYQRELEGFWGEDNRLYFPTFEADGY